MGIHQCACRREGRATYVVTPRKSPYLAEIENKIELAHVTKVAIEHFDVAVDDLEHEQLVRVRSDTGHEEETRIAVEREVEIFRVG